MTKENVMSFTKKVLQTAIKNLAKEGKIFSNESQFQLDLAWELKKQGFHVELEVLTANVDLSQFASLSKEKREKYYTDIIVKDEGGYIAIELKYKTPRTGKLMRYKCNNENYYLAAQGAENIDSYLYWKDVERLEKMVRKGIPLNFDRSKMVKKGYAVLLTNDTFYWDGNKRGVSLAQEFFLKKGTVVNGCIKGTFSGESYSINLQGTYRIDAQECQKCSYNSQCVSMCEWEDYLSLTSKPNISEVEIYNETSSAIYTAGSIKLPGYLSDGFCYLIVEVLNGQPACITSST